MEKIKADVAVIGTGAAGMAAAIRAAEGGAKVVIFEKRPFPGGASNTPMCVASTKKDPEYQDKAFKVHMEMTQQAGNAELVRAWINKSGELPDWLTNQGYQLGPVMASATLETMGKQRGYGVGFPNGYFIHDVYFLPPRGKGHGGAMLIRHLVKRAEDLGVDIRLAMPAKKIIKEGDKISGVIAEDKTGNQVRVEARAVIVASAGFNEDKDMIKKYGMYDFTLDPSPLGGGEGDLFFVAPNLKLTGDGQKMAWAAGADKGAIGIGLIPHIHKLGIGGVPPWITFNQLMTIMEQPYLWVNQQGKRYYDESFSDEHMSQTHAIARQYPKSGYIVFDNATKRHLETVGPDYQYFIFEAKTIDDVDRQFSTAIAAGNKDLFVADSLRELAQKTGIDENGLKRTVDEYNGCCEKGHDDLFGKNPTYLRPVKEPKFYAMRIRCCAYQTIGGIRVNGKTEALTKERKVVPGLYAAGDIIVAEAFGDPPINGVGTLGFALSSGLIAAESSLAYLNITS
ncbi:MAG: FAD-dependent oxidoreductase [Desulfatitalea sp.]|nr:FAD-dependent oxidoreductase [Desulfatitalea sp.]NNK00747.1 FAD-dependent oxidoreductase [Desulfatitalea sp.]